MKKFFKNLAVWWGWMFYKKPLLTFFVVLFALSSLNASMTLIFKQFWLFSAGLLITFMLLILGDKFSDMSRNWRVAVAEAKILARDWKQDQGVINIIGSFIQRTIAEKSGTDLSRFINDLRKLKELKSQLDSTHEEEKVIIAKRAEPEKEYFSLDEFLRS
jgi:hypothetical protein